MTNRVFTLAGWGSSGAVQEEGMSEDHFVSEVYHSGENVVNQISDNMLQYTFDDAANGGLATEAMGHFGDSGSGALVEQNGTLFIAGVKSNGEDGFFGSSHEYTRAGGITRAWIYANLDSIDANVPVESCDAYTGEAGSPIYDGGDDQSGGEESDYGDYGDDSNYGDDDGNYEDDDGNYGDDDGTLWCDECDWSDDDCWEECFEYDTVYCFECDWSDDDCWEVCEDY